MTQKVLLPTVFGPLVNDSEVVKGVYVTAFVGIFIGVLAFGAIDYASEAKSKTEVSK